MLMNVDYYCLEISSLIQVIGLVSAVDKKGYTVAIVVIEVWAAAVGETLAVLSSCE